MKRHTPLAASIILILCSVSCASTAPQPSPTTKEQDIRKLLEVSGRIQLEQQVMTTMMKQFRQGFPKVSQDFWSRFEAQADLKELNDRIIPVYDKHFTQEEIRQLIAFYSTPIGRKMVHEQPAVAQESMEVGQQWGEELAERIFEELHEAGYSPTKP